MSSALELISEQINLLIYCFLGNILSVTENLYMQLLTTKRKGWQDCGTMWECISSQGTRRVLKGFSKKERIPF